MSKFCRQCGAPLKPQAKFCGKCGASVQPQAAQSDQTPGDVVGVGGKPSLNNTTELNQPIAKNSHLIWNLQSGQIAQKLPANWMDYYDTAKGIIIHPGTMGLFYVNGKFRTRIESGEYIFETHAKSGDAGPSNSHSVKDAIKTGATDVSHSAQGAVSSAISGAAGVVVGGFRWVANLFGGGKKVSGKSILPLSEENPQITEAIQQEIIQATRAERAIQVVLIRGAGFPIVGQYSNVSTASIQANVGVELFVYVKDADAFYQRYLLDHTLVTSEQVRNDLDSVIQLVLNNCCSSIKAEEISNNAALQSNLLNGIRTQLESSLPHFGIQQVLSVSSSSEDLVRIKQLSDELYISERELDQLVNRNEFKNRLRLEENKQKIRSVSQDNALEAEMRSLNKDRLLDESEFQKYVLMIKNDLRITAAKTEDEYLAAITEIEKSGLLREEEIALLNDQIEFNRESKSEEYRSSLDLQHISSRIESAKAELRFEREVGDDQIKLETDRSRKALLQDWDEQRITLEIEKEKAQSKSGLAQAEIEARKIWEEYDRESEKKRREDELDLQQREDSLELEKLKAMQELKQAKDDAEHKRDMEAVSQSAEAEVKRLEAEAQRWQGMSADQILAANPDISDAAANAFAARYNGEKAEQAAEEKKQMVDEMMDRQERMMKEMMGTVAQVASSQAIQKDKEIDRANQAAQSQTEAVTRAVGAGAAAVGEGVKGVAKPIDPATKICPTCGTAEPLDSAFCESCGASI